MQRTYPCAVASLSRFSPLTRAWFEGAFAEPTSAQEQGWEAISEGQNTLILAPTGSGKTLAAFLWVIDQLLAQREQPPEKERCRGLYVSPLEALTYDVDRNLRAPLAGIALQGERAGEEVATLRTATRTGDTPAGDRRDIVRHPPDVLITTPESLYLMLTSSAREILKSVEYVVVDEIHAVAGTKRGAHLALSLERLERLTEKPPQRIGLSATQRPLDEIARFLGGRAMDPQTGEWRPRPVTVVDAGVRKPLDLQVVVPVEDMGELGKVVEPQILEGPAAGDPEVRSSIWPAITPVLLDLIRQHHSTLVFVNSRRLAERLAARLNDLAGKESSPAHTGPVRRDQDLRTEEPLKTGKVLASA